MAFFEKKPKKLTLDEILKGIEALTEEEQEKVYEAINGNAEVENESETETNTETVVEDNAPAPVVEQEQAEGEENPENPETDETPEEPENSEETEGEGDGEEEAQEAEEAEDKIDEHIQGDGEMKAWMQKVTDTLEELKQAIAGIKRQPQEVEKTEADKLDALAKKFE